MSALIDRTDRFAVIGAGFSGLGVMAAMQRHGVEFDAFEADDEVGGNWYHGVYETVHIISSRKTTEYDDWPMPADWPDFPSKDQMLSYLRGYADHHRLREKIAFGTAVQRLVPAGDGQWELTLPSGERRLYGGVVVAIGHHWQKRWPHYPGEFTGETIHSKDYKAPERLRGKRVLVIGGGNSACDIAVEAARFSESAHISVRRGYWFMPKTMFGVPTVEFIKPWMPLWSQRLLLRGLIRVIVGKYSDYGLPEPDHPIFEHHPTINSELLYYIRHGRISPHPDVARWDGEYAEFTDGRRERFDLVVCATGYDLGFPFLEDDVIRWDGRGMPDLIDGLVSPRHKNIYFFGNSQPRYGAGPLISAGAELLCTMIEVQRQLKAPIGRLLQRLGHKPPRTWVADPIEILKNTRRGRKLLPRLARYERWLVPDAV
jgi:hypothetical protein